jgi:Mg-chelatase subunit ChlD
MAKRWRTWFVWAQLAAGPLGLTQMGFAQTAKLEFTEKPVMVSCELTNAPCFRLKFNIVDDKGEPAPRELPASEQLARSLNIHMGERTILPFFVSIDGEGQQRTVRPRVAMILIDVSGSMNTRLKTGQTRFEAATAAASIFLNGFQEGADRLAVAPFGSKQVIETIRSARFADSKQAVMDELAAIPRPDPKANTGLYSAVVAALDALSAAARQVPGAPETMLIVMTDGENDVEKGDDPGLLTGSQGLEAVAHHVEESGIPVQAIGFGSRDEIDETALRRIGTKYNMTEDPEDLKRLFTVARALLNSRIRVTFESPWMDRASLAGRSFPFTAELRLPSGETLRSNEVTWSTPQMGIPAYQGKCEEAEARALLVRNRLQQSTGWLGIAILRPLVVFAGLGVLLLILWFGVPRLIWPERYEHEEAALRPERWVGETRMEQPAYGRKPPRGIEKRDPGMAERSPSDQTIVRARDPYATRTRLD